MAKYSDPFLQHRKAQEQAHVARTAGSHDPMASLVSVEMNITELCNRTCVFCPRVDPKIYPNRNLHMDLGISEKVSADLVSIGYAGRISFSGFGEPVLNKEFTDHIHIFREALPDCIIESNTNGDQLTEKVISGLFEAGISALYVNLYDGPEQEAQFKELFAKADIDPNRYHLRPHWAGANDFGLTLNNRSGMVDNSDIGVTPLDRPQSRRCHYPFYKMFVDWNGNVLFCANDWGREILVGNVMEKHIKDIWMSQEMEKIRYRLADGDRGHSPCNKCSVEGTLHGGTSFDHLMRYYEERV